MKGIPYGAVASWMVDAGGGAVHDTAAGGRPGHNGAERGAWQRSVRYLARDKTLGVEFRNWHDRHRGCASLALILESPDVDLSCIIDTMCPVSGRTPAQILHVRRAKHRRSLRHLTVKLSHHAAHIVGPCDQLRWLASYQVG